MDDLLAPMNKITAKRGADFERQPDTLPTRSVEARSDNPKNIESPDQVSQILRNQPDLHTVSSVLNYLTSTSDSGDDFNLVTPSPVSAQVVDILVSQTVPDYWRSIEESSHLAKQIVSCLRSANGIGAIFSRLRPLIADCRQNKNVENTRDATSQIEDLIDVIEKVLSGHRTSSQIWQDIQKHSRNPTEGKLMWNEYVAQVASGRILSLVAEAESILKQKESSHPPSWLGTGKDYAAWLGRNIAILVKEAQSKDGVSAAIGQLCGKAMALGYLDHIVASLVEFAVDEGSSNVLAKLISQLKAHEQRKYFNQILIYVSNRYFGTVLGDKNLQAETASPVVSGVARILHDIIKGNELLRDHLVTTLTRSSIPALDGSLTARRSVIAALAPDDEKLHSVLEQAMKISGDSFYIAHTPVMRQEALAQTLLITCGYVQRSQPMFLTMMAKSSYHTSGTSNRIGSSSPRARFLGMMVSSAISKLVDPPELQLKFELEGEEATEAEWYRRLTEVDDKIGSLQALKAKDTNKAGPQRGGAKGKQSSQAGKPAKAKAPAGSSSVTEISGPRIVEILSESEDEDDDLVPYEKPDSDPEDDTDDPTEINRNKPTAPVYIRDLIADLRDQENYDRHQLALATAAPLIRRKTNFGTEVTDHIEELASILTSLQDTYDLPDFDIQRQQALIAVLLAQPGPMAQWFARAFFSGDYSIAQRIAMLTTLGLGARELAGLKDTSTENILPPTPDFPSKKLPPNLHTIYSSEPNPVARITGNLTKEMLSPLAASAADQLTGPNILKVRTFSTRMEAEKRRSKPIPNALAKIVADNFFFPLTGRWWMATRSSSSSDSIYTSQHLLPPFLQTLALLMHASGQNTLALPQMTREFWELLLSVRTIAARDKGVLRALLFSFLMLLETNADKERLATEQARELLETQQWVQMVFNELGTGSEEDEKVRVLAAGVVVRCQEVVEKYQRRMVGSMMDY